MSLRLNVLICKLGKIKLWRLKETGEYMAPAQSLIQGLFQRLFASPVWAWRGLNPLFVESEDFTFIVLVSLTVLRINLYRQMLTKDMLNWTHCLLFAKGSVHLTSLSISTLVPKVSDMKKKSLCSFQLCHSFIHSINIYWALTVC